MASSSTTSLSVQKSQSASAVCCKDDSSERRKSCDTLCSSNSSCFLKKKKPLHPLAMSVHPHTVKSTGNMVKQRVLSAKLLKLRSLQSELNDAKFHLVELSRENRALKTLQRRQDKALNSYEGKNAELPRLIKSHEEEIRILQGLNKQLKKSLKETTEQLKAKDEELNHVKEQLKHILSLTKDKNLLEREKLAEIVEELQEDLKKSSNQVSVLNRRLMLEAKNYKYKINTEVQKFKQSQRDLAHALTDVDRLTALIEAKGNNALTIKPKKRFTNSVSMVTLDNKVKDDKLDGVEDIECKLSTSQTEVKLEPLPRMSKESLNIKNATTKENASPQPEEEIKEKPPLKNVRMTVSQNRLKIFSDDKKMKQMVDDSKNKGVEKSLLGTLNVSDTELEDFNEKKEGILERIQKARMASAQKIDKLTENIQKISLNPKEEMDQELGEYCSKVLSDVQTNTLLINKHEENFEVNKILNDTILDKLKEADQLDLKLRTNKVVSKEEFSKDINIPEKDLELVNKIWRDEYAIQKTLNRNPSAIKRYNMLMKSTDKNGNIKEPDVPVENRKKLLATLRAIDNGESVDVSSSDEEKSLSSLRETKTLLGD